MADQRTVVILPGRNYGPYAPQTFFPMMAAVRRGAEPLPISWRDVDGLDNVAFDKFTDWVARQVEEDLRGLDPGTTLVIGKSLGSYGAELVADLGLPAIWVTPVMTSKEITGALRRTRSPFLLVGGTADHLWDSSVARELSPYVLELDDADHGLFVPGPLDQSAANFARLAEACEQFIDDHVWPLEGRDEDY